MTENYHYPSSGGPHPSAAATTTPPTFGSIMGNGRRVRHTSTSSPLHQQHSNGFRSSHTSLSGNTRTKTRLHPSGCSSFSTSTSTFPSSQHDLQNNYRAQRHSSTTHSGYGDTSTSNPYHNDNGIINGMTTTPQTQMNHTDTDQQFVDDLLFQVRGNRSRPNDADDIISPRSSSSSSTSERLWDGTQRLKLFVWGIMPSSTPSLMPSFFKRKNDNNNEQHLVAEGGGTNGNDWINNLLTPSASSSQSDMVNDSNNRRNLNSNKQRQQQSRVEGMALIGLVLCVFVLMNVSMTRNVEKTFLKKIPGTKISGRAAADIARAERHFHGESAQTLSNKEGFMEQNRHEYIQQTLRQTTSTTTTNKGPQRVVGGVVQIPETTTNAGAAGSSSSSSITTTYNDNFKKTENVSSLAASGVHRDAKLGEQTTSVIALPKEFNYVATLPSQPTSTDIPMFWHVPKSGGTFMKQILGHCLKDVVVGSELGSLASPPNNGKSIQIVEVAGQKVIDLNLYHPKDIQQAAQLQLVADRKADVLVSPYLHEVARLFTSRNNGRLFTLLRHPIERAQSTYWHLVETQLASHPLKAPMTLADYAQSSRIENNWMTRFLSGKMAGPLSKQDLVLAKQLLKTKFMIGLLTKKEESLRRLDEYFGWNLFPSGGSGRFSTMILSHKAKQVHACVKETLQTKPQAHNSHGRSSVATNSKEYHLLVMQNSFDIELYEYAEQLFEEQKSLFM